MIIQCDHCNARFKMDDSKLANGPVKVRCAKCKKVFVVRPEELGTESVTPPPLQVPPPLDRTAAAEFSFDAPSETNKPSATTADEFSFDDEPPAASQKANTSQPDPANEFDWQSGTAPDSDAAETKSRFDLSDFDASLDAPKAAVDSASTIAEDNDFDFGEIDFSSQSAPAEASSLVVGSTDPDDFAMDFGEVSFSEQTAPGGNPETSSGVAAEEVAFTGSQPPSNESATASDFLLSFAADSTQEESAPVTSREMADKVIPTDFSFTSKGESVEQASNQAGVDLQSESDNDFTASGFSQVESEEDLVPSSLTSRKKSGSLFPLAVIAGAIFLIIALVGAGVYFFGGPKAFSKVGLGFLVDWYGDKGAEEGNIALKGVTASYIVNSTAGEFFVVRGEAVNNYTKPRASIQVKVTLFGTGEAKLVTKTAYCGNSLSNEQLTALPLAKIEEIMNNQFGDSLVNLGLKPGGTIPFVVVVSPLPNAASAYSVVVGGSTVATQ